jgi:indole-3-glycerol phosphate synthase
LNEILAATRASLAERRRETPVAALEDRAEKHKPRGFISALRAQAGRGPSIIAELKKASPSRGVIRENFNARALASQFEAAGATALSVLTDRAFFQGSLENLEAASAATRLPCLRKDFIVDEYQVVEARAHGADAVLLIAAALTDAELADLSRAAATYGLDVLWEVHTREEAARIARLPLEIAGGAIGVNNRNLRTFEVKLENSLELIGHLPAGPLRVAESGIRSPEDYARLRAAGYEGFLIGETFMRYPEPGPGLARWIMDAAALALQQA